MSMTGNDIKARVQDFLQDEDDGDQKWNPERFVDSINSRVNSIVARRPDARFADAGTLLTIANLTALGSTVSIDAKWLDCIAHGCCADAMMFRSGVKLNTTAAKFHEETFDKLVATL